MTNVRLDSLSVRHKSLTVVRDVSLTIAEGQVVGLVGESGSGKTSIAHAIVGLVQGSGHVYIDDVDVLHARAREVKTARRKVQLVFQDPRSSLDPRFSVHDAIAEGLARRSSGRSRNSTTARVAELLDHVALDPALRESRITALSGGQRQRVAIARALASEPELLVADEVTASLDVSVQAVVLNLLRDLQQRLGLSILFISHNIAVVRYMSDHVAVLQNGRIVEAGTVDDVISRPQEEYTRTLLKAVPSIAFTRPIEQAVAEIRTSPARPTPLRQPGGISMKVIP